MTLLIYAGLLYLLGISILLTFKPELMFSKNGDWKEFGLGRNREQYTWMPFWLFAIIWAIISYTIVLVIVGNRQENTPNTNLFNRRSTSLKEGVNYEVMDGEDMEPAAKPFRKGYYIMNVNTKNGGTPQYIYLGPRAPNLHYDED